MYLLFNHKPYFIAVFRLFKYNLTALPINNRFRKFIVCYGADMLWSASFCFAIQTIYCLKGRKLLYLLCCSLLGIAYELLQMADIVSGTFDIFDIVVYVVGTIGAMIIIKTTWRVKDE